MGAAGHRDRRTPSLTRPQTPGPAATPPAPGPAQIVSPWRGLPLGPAEKKAFFRSNAERVFRL